MTNATTVRAMLPYWYPAATRPFLGAAHCMSDRLPEEWPECPPTQMLVAMVVFVSVLCCCIYGLLSKSQDERREGPRPRDERRAAPRYRYERRARLQTPDYNVVYRVLSETLDERSTGTRTPTPDADVVFARVDSRWSLDGDERYRVHPAMTSDSGRWTLRWPFTRRTRRASNTVPD
ncbi:hypothetical protein HPB51_023332 [Rhipicephalus microplus]|uniref:Uncharacterized protein n=1 Tax=Rhipicephalus microplus TaxID=6941 RepID=A0A9J6EQ76_RHIMP|nr:hypothetical protein HPB51_023332 [Rhipicephalus microplus]